MKLLRAAIVLEMLGLLLALLSLLHFHRLTMTAFFALGIPAVLAGLLLYVATVLRVLVRKGAL